MILYLLTHLRFRIHSHLLREQMTVMIEITTV